MKRRDEVLVGVLTTVALIVGILGAIWLARGGLSNGYGATLTLTQSTVSGNTAGNSGGGLYETRSRLTDG